MIYLALPSIFPQEINKIQLPRLRQYPPIPPSATASRHDLVCSDHRVCSASSSVQSSSLLRADRRMKEDHDCQREGGDAFGAPSYLCARAHKHILDTNDRTRTDTLNTIRSRTGSGPRILFFIRQTYPGARMLTL